MQGYLLTVLLLQQDSGYHFVYCFKDDISIGFLPAFEDVFAFNLNYFAGDYAAISGAIAFPGHSAYMPNPADNRPLYNGNISSMATASVNFPGATAEKQPQLCNYSYDQLNRITGIDVYRCTTLNTNSWSGMVATGDFKERMAYDANGNILKYLRQGFGSNLPMDSLSYNYTYNSGKLVNNKLNYVTDQINGSTTHSTNYTDDIEDQAAGNYVYDRIGNLTADAKEGVTNITWNVYGKIKQVQRTATAANPVTNIKYTYDAGGNRISKQVTKSAADSVEYTWYVRDASGNIMTTYFAKGAPNGTIASTTTSLLLTGQTMYGSSRLGVVNRNVDVKPLFTNSNLVNFTRGNKFFELTNHLGNVMETISDKKTGVTTNGTSIDYYYSEVITANDYYSFGSQMPGRQYKLNANSYRYGFNGKENDNEVKGEGNQQDYGMRIYDPRLGRFLSEDPITKEYPELTPYQFASNTPIQATDLDGLEADFSAVHANKMDYEDDDKWYHKVGKFVGNTGISLWNGGVSTVETTVNSNALYNATNNGAGYKKIGGGIKNAAVGAYDWTVNTSGSQKWQDVKDVATNPHTYEDVAALLITRKISKGIGAKTSPATTTTTAAETQRLLPASTSKVAAAQQKLATAAKGTQGSGTFIVSETGTTISTSQGRMIQSFNNAGFPSWQTQSPGIGYTLPNGNTVRAMQPSGGAPLRTSFESSKGQPVNIDGKSVNPPKGTTNTKQYVRDRTHVTQTQ